VIVAFRSDLATISLLNGTTGAGMVSADVSGTVNGYCRSHTVDPDCAAAPGGSDLMLFSVIAIIVVLLAGAGWFLVKKKGTTEQKPPAP
jgi:hypothetical protein